MYKLIDDIKDYQRKFGKEPDMETIKDWAEIYAEEEKDFFYEKPCSTPLTYIMYFTMFLLGSILTILGFTLCT